MSETIIPDKVQAARESFNGRGLTEAQFQKAWAIAAVLRAEIQERGTFREALTDFSHAFARGEKFDALRAEGVLRDVFGGRYSQSLNAYRESLEESLQSLPESARDRALAAAESVATMIQEGQTRPAYQANDAAAVTLSQELGITKIGAQNLMNETFKATHGVSLYNHSKDIEQAYHKPVREAEIAVRKVEKLQIHYRSQSMV